MGLIPHLGIPLYAYFSFHLQLSLMFSCLLFPLSLQTELECFDTCFACKQTSWVPHPLHPAYFLRLFCIRHLFSQAAIAPQGLFTLSICYSCQLYYFETSSALSQIWTCHQLGFWFFQISNFISFSKVRKHFLKTSINQLVGNREGWSPFLPAKGNVTLLIPLTFPPAAVCPLQGRFLGIASMRANWVICSWLLKCRLFPTRPFFLFYSPDMSAPSRRECEPLLQNWQHKYCCA